MADITMCDGFNCPVTEKCYRYNASPDKYQTMFVDAPGEIKDGVFTCDVYWGENSEAIWGELKKITTINKEGNKTK